MGVISDLFSSPGKQAQQAGSASQALSQNEINQAEGYVSGAEGNERNAIASIGDNPYFGGSGGAEASNPNGNPIGQPVALDPSNTVKFGSTGVSPAPTVGTNPYSGAPNPAMRRPS
jgi:hypothetical protein